MEIASKHDKLWDVFISYASEDKIEIARPLASSLQNLGFSVWFDEFALRPGDSLLHSIETGLAHARCGIVIISPSFFKKKWTQMELAGLFARETGQGMRIIPIWHKITVDEVREISPILADRYALDAAVGMHGLTSRLTRELVAYLGPHDVAGVWIGESGRLRLFPNGSGGYSKRDYEGEYDWNLKERSGRIDGSYFNRSEYPHPILIFRWKWEPSSETGWGFFLFDHDLQELRGGWVLGQLPRDTARSLEGLQSATTPWIFKRKSSET